MKCPSCKEVTLLISEKQGIEIDYCPECRGIWLDRGELEKIIERSANLFQNEQSNYRNDHSKYENDHHDRDDDFDEQRSYGGKKPYKKKSFLGDIFDF